MSNLSQLSLYFVFSANNHLIEFKPGIEPFIQMSFCFFKKQSYGAHIASSRFGDKLVHDGVHPHPYGPHRGVEHILLNEKSRVREGERQAWRRLLIGNDLSVG